ncbi:unnamed protein product [Clonostachys rhizophaga]|uniref:SMP-30/Gluconolactonase/LRE-like region domain-containing protein n=1 Tax=Clonostachys rhizophaga TaxID=160324 RepID=A0A9N9YQF4_9HYPO|nr:unnamed protein product [Clonostachys rhizophaga]
MRFTSFTHMISLAALARVQAKPFPQDGDLNLPTHTVASVNQAGSWLENLAVRPNGDLLVTMMVPDSTLYHVQSPGSANAQLVPLYKFPNATGLVGITELGNDRFAVNMHNFSSFVTPVADTGAVWEISFSNTHKDDFTARKVTVIKGAGFLNGMTPFTTKNNKSPKCKAETSLIVADSYAGVIRRVDLSTGTYETILDAPELKPGADSPFGVNGVHVRGDHLYFTNTALRALYRIAIDSSGFPLKNAAVEVLLSLPDIAIIDDFAFDKKGNIWAAASSNNTVLVIYKNGGSKEYSTYKSAAGEITSLALGGVTATAFGKGGDSHTLFASTSGASAFPVNGTATEPGKVVAVDLSSVL